MKGLELSRLYFEKYGRTMLEENFSSVIDKIAVGLIGSGSECLGFDDEFSTDHDFEPGFCIFLPGEDVVDRKTEFALERAYYKLPKEFMGFKRSLLSPVGGNRHGVIRIGDFYKDHVGDENGELTIENWLTIEQNYLLECTNGEIYFDNFGLITKIRDNLKFYPEDVRLKKIAGNLLLMAQSGQYNFNRCLNHGEIGAANIACYKFIESALSVIYLLNNKYMPYYKWYFRGIKDTDKLGHLKNLLESLTIGDNTNDTMTKKKETIEYVCGEIIEELKNQNLSIIEEQELENHAYSVNDKIENNNIRNLNILAAV